MNDDDPKITRINGGRKPVDPIQELKEMVQGIFGGGGRAGGSGGNQGNGSGSGAGGGGNRPAELNFKQIFSFVGALVLAWGAFTSFYTIDVSEEGVVTRFGAYNRTSPSGMHFKLPFDIENVVKVQSKRILQEEFGFRTKGISGTGSSTYDKREYTSESLMLTGDLNVADVEWILQYRISDPWKFLFHARDVQRNIRDISMSIMRRVVGDRLVGDVLTTGRVEIADQAKLLTQEVLDRYDQGLVVERVILQGVNPPETVKPAFNEVNAAKQEQEKTINVAEREYNRIIPEARGLGERLVADAQGYGIDIVNRAKGNATQFEEVLKAYKMAPEITRRRLYLDTMEDVFSKVERFTVVDREFKGAMPIYLMPGMPNAAAEAKQAALADRQQISSEAKK